VNLEEEPPAGPRERLRRKQVYALMIVALLGAVAAGVLLASSVWQWKWDTHGSQQTQTAAVQVDPAKSCVLQSTLDAIKTELFRRAAQSRGRDSDAYTRIAGFSLLRIDSPSVVRQDDQRHVVDCTGNADLELPPQITLAAGGTMVSGPIDYSVQLDGSGNPVGVVVGDAGFIVGPLATIQTLAPPQPLTEAAPENVAVPAAVQNETAPTEPTVDQPQGAATPESEQPEPVVNQQ
jgi:hypothetical protein